ncbi:MAG: winged helix-turn-helix domain-containing protein [Lysobacterales bacterium]
MNPQDQHTRYQFLDCVVSSDRQMLCRNHENTRLGTKVYYLLLTFLQNPGKVLTKNQIIDTVWPGQIVTDAALTKQILRLRKVLTDSDSDQPIIETHRGVGYRFNAPVIAQPGNAETAKPAMTLESSKRSYVALVLLLALLLFVARPLYETGQKTDSQSASPAPIGLAIVPARNSQDWFNRGGLEYLSELLGQHPLIHAINPEPEWFASESPERLAIDLSTKKNIGYSCVIDVSESATGFVADLQLRTKDEVISSASLEASTLPQLFEKTDQWISSNLSIHDDFSQVKQSVWSTIDPYTLQSYLQGLLETEIGGNEQKGMEYFQAAVNKEEAFLPAWIKLAESHMELGNLERAISIVDTLLQSPDVQQHSSASIELHYIKAMAYIKLRDDDRARESVQVSEENILNLGDPYQKLAGLKSLILLALLQNDWGKAESYTLESLAISSDYYALPSQLADLQYSLAQIYFNDFQYSKMHEYLDLAIHNYEKINNSNGMIASFGLLNHFNYNQGNLDAGAQVAARAEPYLDSCTAPHDLMKFLQSTSLMLNLRGHFDRSERYIERIRGIAKATNNSYFAYLGEHIDLHRYYVQNKFEQARIRTEVISAILDNENVMPSSRAFSYSVKLLINSRVTEPETAEKMMREYIAKYPLLKEQFPDELARAEGHISTRLGHVNAGVNLLKTTEQNYRDKNEPHIANYIGFEILEILLDNPELEYKDTITRLESYTEYDYLFFKLKAQFSAREGDFLKAALLMQENKLKANQLWKAEDQLLLEAYQQNTKSELVSNR